MAALGFATKLKIATFRSQRYLSTVSVGDSFRERRSFTSAQVEQFAQITGDTNPIHLDEMAARSTGLYSAPLVHGAFVNGFVAGLLGTRMPGPGTVAFAQQINYPGPLYVGEMVEAELVVTKVRKRYVEVDITCRVEGESGADAKTVMTGQATVRLT